MVYGIDHYYINYMHCGLRILVSDPHSYEATKAVTKKSLLTYSQQSFTAQLVEHHTGITEAMGSNPVRGLRFFVGFLCNCSSFLYNCKDHFPLAHFFCKIVK